jgi:hypothetical protein
MEIAIPTTAAFLDKKIVFAKDRGLKFDWDWWDPQRLATARPNYAIDIG